MNRDLEERVEMAWQSIPANLRDEIERNMSFCREDVSAEVLIDFIASYTGQRYQELRANRILQEAIQRIEFDAERRVESTIAELKHEHVASLRCLERELIGRLEEIKRVFPPQQTPQALPISVQVGKPALPDIAYTDCIRYHDPTPENPSRRPGPQRCVMTWNESDGTHMQCLVAYSSQNPGDKGFARLRFQIFHEELLRQGDCPRPLSRNVSRRIPIISFLFNKPEICPLADGEVHVIELNFHAERR